jgi:hypothetical protein
MRACGCVAVATLVSLLALESSSAQENGAAQRRASATASYRGRVLGVFDATSGIPLADVKVLDLATGTSALTTVTGTVSLMFLPDGGSLVRLQKIGYEPVSMIVPISPSDTTPITVVLRRIAELPTVVSTANAPRYISPGLRGFAERQRLGFAGYFIGDSVLRREENRRLADVLRTHAPGVMIREGSGSSALLLESPRCAVGGHLRFISTAFHSIPPSRPAGDVGRPTGYRCRSICPTSR